VKFGADIPRGVEVRAHPNFAVAEVLSLVASGQPHASADRDGERIAVLSAESQVGGEAEIANAPFAWQDVGLAAGCFAGNRAVTALLDRDERQAGGDSQSVEESERAAHVEVELMGEDSGVLRAIRIQ